jgi:hypothetical protein
MIRLQGCTSTGETGTMPSRECDRSRWNAGRTLRPQPSEAAHPAFTLGSALSFRHRGFDAGEPGKQVIDLVQDQAVGLREQPLGVE